MIFLIIDWPNFVYLLVDPGFLSLSLKFLWSIAIRSPIGWTSVRSFVCLLDGVWHIETSLLSLRLLNSSNRLYVRCIYTSKHKEQLIKSRNAWMLKSWIKMQTKLLGPLTEAIRVICMRPCHPLLYAHLELSDDAGSMNLERLESHRFICNCSPWTLQLNRKVLGNELTASLSPPARQNACPAGLLRCQLSQWPSTWRTTLLPFALILLWR